MLLSIYLLITVYFMFDDDDATFRVLVVKGCQGCSDLQGRCFGVE
jgi:hypothetical protein